MARIEIANVRRSLSDVGYIPMRFWPDSVPLDARTTSYDEKAVFEAPVDEEASYSCTETLVGSSDESAVGSDESISDCSEWSISGEESFSDVNNNRTWLSHMGWNM